MDWEPRTEEKFRLMISKIPVFHRHITQEAVTKKAGENSVSRGAARIEEQDVVAAFFSDVPTPFYSMMVRLLDEVGFDYNKFGFPKKP